MHNTYATAAFHAKAFLHEIHAAGAEGAVMACEVAQSERTGDACSNSLNHMGPKG